MSFNDFIQWFKSYADKNLSEWSRLYNVPKPGFRIDTDYNLEDIYDFHGGPFYDSIREVIVFPLEHLKHLYTDAYRKNMMDPLHDVVSWELAHEFGHYVRRKNGLDIKYIGMARLSRWDLIEKAKRRIEAGANVIARRLTGISRREEKKMLREILGMPIVRYIDLRHEEWDKMVNEKYG